MALSSLTPVDVAAIIFWVSMAGCCGVYLRRKNLSLRERIWIFTIVGIALVARWPLGRSFFHGLEYEDSYVYSVDAREIALHEGQMTWSSATPFGFSTCTLGSLSHCDLWTSYPEHLIGYPYALSVAIKVFGYTPNIGSWFNLVCAIVSCVLVFSIARRLTGESDSGLRAAAIFALVPVFAVNGLETSAEPFSSLWLLLVIDLLLLLIDVGEQRGRMLLIWLAFTSVLLFALLIKRENALLLVLLPMLVAAFQRESTSLKHAVLVVAMSAIVGLFLVLQINLSATSAFEGRLTSSFSYAVSKAWTFVEAYFSSFLNPLWYIGTPVLVAAAVFRMRRRDPRGIVLSVLFAYLFLYAIHIRSYGEMYAGTSSPYRALRFNMNVMGLWAVACAFGFEQCIRIWPAKWRQNSIVFRLVIGLGVIICLGLTEFLHDREAEDEGNVRIQPTADAIEAWQVNRSLYIATATPLLPQMYGPVDAQIADLTTLDVKTVQAVYTSHGLLLVATQEDLSDDQELRYGDTIRYVRQLRGQSFANGDGYEVVLLNNGAIP